MRVDVARHCPACRGDVVVEWDARRPRFMRCRRNRVGGDCDWREPLDAGDAEHYVIVACLRL
jgi:hypothetical protein